MNIRRASTSHQATRGTNLQKSSTASTSQVELAGSQCPGGADRVGNLSPSDKMSVSVLLKHDAQLPEPGLFQSVEPKDVARYAASPQQIAAIKAFAKSRGLKVSSVDPNTHTVKLSGDAGQFGKAFGVSFGKYKDAAGQEFRGYQGAVKLPAKLAGTVDGVLGLQNRPFAKPHCEMLAKSHKSEQSYNPDEIAKLYDFPKGTTGKGQTIGIIELGGGYKQSDLKAYFKKLGIKEPHVTSVSVDGAKNDPTGDPNGPDGEVNLDIDVAGAAAPDANIVVYFAPNTDQGFVDAINQAAHDQKNHPNALSISWGSAESEWSKQSLAAMNGAIKDAASMGVNVFVAAGDDGSGDAVHDGANHVDFPASSPWSVATGGTHISTSNGNLTNETAWNDTAAHMGSGGGGVSDDFPLPDYQQGSGVPAPTDPAGGRGVPDVSGDASPASGYNVRVDGKNVVYGGTSAVAPLYAALAARLGQGLGSSLGFLDPILYQNGVRGDFNDITSGNNGSFKAGPGWDPVTGLGSPDGQKLLASLKARRAADGLA